MKRVAQDGLRRLVNKLSEDLCALRVLRGEMINMSPHDVSAAVAAARVVE